MISQNTIDLGSLGQTLGVVSVVVGAGTAYLRIFVAKEIAELKNTIAGGFVTREALEKANRELERRIEVLEGRRR